MCIGTTWRAMWSGMGETWRRPTAIAAPPKHMVTTGVRAARCVRRRGEQRLQMLGKCITDERAAGDSIRKKVRTHLRWRARGPVEIGQLISLHIELVRLVVTE